MRFAVVFFIAIILQAVILQTTFKPGFIAPDITLSLLIAYAYLHGRSVVYWAVVGGTLLDFMTDTLGLNLTMLVFGSYLFVLIVERFMFRSFLTFLIPAVISMSLKKLISVILMSFKFSFDLSPTTLILSLVLEALVVSGIYFSFLRNRHE